MCVWMREGVCEKECVDNNRSVWTRGKECGDEGRSMCMSETGWGGGGCVCVSMIWQ